MKELFRTNNIVELSWAQSVLKDEGVESIVLDMHASIVEGSIGAIQQRLMVADEMHYRAEKILAYAKEQLDD